MKWQIKDLKGVGDVELSLDDSKRVFVFFGSNGVGKTKTLEALLLFFLVKNSCFYTNIQIESVLAKQIARNEENILIEQPYFKWRDIKKQINRQEDFAFAYVSSGQRSRVTEPTSIIQQIGTIENRQSSYFKTIAKALSTGNLKNLGGLAYLNEWFVSRAQASNAFQKESSSSQNEIYTVLDALNIIDSRIEKTMQIDGANHVYLTIEGQETKLTELSSGFISVVKIIQTIVSSFALFTSNEDILNTQGVVLIDEIESHLHVEWQTQIIPTLKELFPNTTFYIVTHSPLVLTQLEEGEAYLLKREIDGVVRSHVIDSPNKRILANVLYDAFGIDLNQLKRQSMIDSDQSLAKQRLLALLDDESSNTNDRIDRTDIDKTDIGEGSE